MTPAIDIAKQQNIAYTVHEYQHDPKTPSFGEEASVKLGVPAQQVFKTLVVETPDGELMVGVLPVSSQLSLKRFARAVSVRRAISAERAISVKGAISVKRAISSKRAVSIKKVQLANKEKAQRTTGYLAGGISPIGQKKKLTTVIDHSAQDFSTIYISAGRRGLEIELCPSDLLRLCLASYADIQA